MNKNREYNYTDIFEKLPVPKAVRIMVVPTIMGQLIVLLYNMADTFFLGRTNNPYTVAAASLILPIFNISISLAGLSGVGGGALISRLLGQHNHNEARKVSSFSIYLCIVTAALFAIVTFVFMHPLMLLLCAGISIVLYEIFSPQIMRAFIIDSGIVSLGIDFLRV